MAVKAIYSRVRTEDLERLIKERVHHLTLMRKAAASIEALQAERNLLRGKLREMIRRQNGMA